MTLIKTSFFIIIMLVLNSSVCARAQENQGKVIPDLAIYKPFLLNKWKRGAPTLLAINDPFCPYCLRDLKRRSQLQNYNVFLFWAPVLSEGSRSRVMEYFKCESPTDEHVIKAAIDRISPKCTGTVNEELFSLNKQIVENYNPNSVPQYWLGGRRVSLSSLNLFRPEVIVKEIVEQSSIKVDWSRYQQLLVNTPSANRYKIAIVFPVSYVPTADTLSALVDNSEYDWYLSFNTMDKNSDSLFWCKRQPENCLVPTQNRDAEYYSKELQLLSGLEQVSKATFLLEGKVLSEREVAYLIPRNILDILL